MMDNIIKHIPGLTQKQLEQFGQLDALYHDWNAKINVISRKDIDNLYVNHVLHSLSIALFLGPLVDGTTLMDMGTGGGFPGIPLAIYYPQCTLHLIDRIGKKIRVAQEIAREIGLENVTFQHGDIKECRDRYNYVVSRAVMPLNQLVPLITRNIQPEGRAGNGNLHRNGLVCLKGSDISGESAGIRQAIVDVPVTDYINEPRFEEKSIIYVPI